MERMRICRLCGNSGEDEMLNLFLKDDDGIQYYSKVKDCLPIVIYRTDPLSKFICLDCSVSLDGFYKFRLSTVKINNAAIGKLREGGETHAARLYLNGLENGIITTDGKETRRPRGRGLHKNAPGPACSKHRIYVDPALLDANNDENDTAIVKTPIKILTPNNINNIVLQNNLEDASGASDSLNTSFELINSSPHISDVEPSASDSIPEPKIYQPLKLLQYALHSINTTINPQYEADRDHNISAHSHSESGSEPETYSKDPNETFLNNKRKRTLDDSLPLLSDLLHSADLRLKRIKLESDDPYNPEISISLQDSETVAHYSSQGLVINMNYPKRKCKYCGKEFPDINKLAAHEVAHIHVFMGARVDSRLWKDYEDNMVIRNKWLYEESLPEEEEEEAVQNDERIDMVVRIKQEITDDNGEMMDYSDTSNNYNDARTDDDGKGPNMERTTINGISFNLLSKHERFKHYKEVLVDGSKRRECPFCKANFKDVWAADNHFIKNRCIRICKFCHKSYKKDDLTYFEHIKIHSDAPNYAALTKYDHKQYEQQLKKNMIKDRKYNNVGENPVRIEPIKMKYLFQKQNYMTVIKAEPGTSFLKTRLSGEEPEDDKSSGLKQSRTFYCRKCYKVFYTQADLDVHYTECYDSSEASEDEHVGSQKPSAMPLRTKLEIKGKPTHQCQVCFLTFKHASGLGSHMRVHNKVQYTYDTPLIKPRIIESAIRPSTLADHTSGIMDENLARLVQNPHITIRPSNVPVAPATVSNQRIITAPLRYSNVDPTPVKNTSPVPSNERNYRCLPCGRYFPTKSVMYVHKKSECSVAPQAGFVTLPDDSAATNGRKNFRCLPCNKRFNSKTTLYIHKKNVCNRVKVFECPFCKRKFSTESQYTTHILFNHPE